MKKFIINVGLFFLVAVVLPAMLAFMLPSNPDGFYKVYVKKAERAESLDSPKLLIMGGSDVLHAIDSKLIEKELDINVVNMGLTAALGYDVVVNDALQYTQKGDVVLLSLGVFAGTPDYGGIDEIPTLIDYCPMKIWSLSWGNFRQLGRGIYCLLKMKMKYLWFMLKGNDISQTYNFKEFDENGDYKDVLQTNYERTPVNGNAFIGPSQQRFMKSVCERIKIMENRGCKVFIIPETIEKETFQSLYPKITLVKSFYEQNGIHYLFSPEESAVPDSMIFNSQYHVNFYGKQFYSNLIVSYLQENLIVRNNK